jgi:hypothetical protein
MPYKAHRDTDKRKCGAKTVVTGQTTVFVNNLLWAVKGDKNDHGNGKLKLGSNNKGTIFIGENEVIIHGPDDADQDDKCPIEGGDHCNPKTDQGSGDTFAY